MAIKGHKERILLRRGYIQKTIPLNEFSVKRRSLITEDIDELSELCNKYPNSAFCSLKDKIVSSGKMDLLNDIDSIYKFFTKDLKNSNTKVFQKVVDSILKLDSWQNALKVIAATVKSGHEKLITLDKKDLTLDDEERQEIKKTKDKIRSVVTELLNSNKEISQNEIEDLLKNIRRIGYTEYENSFKGVNFDLIKGRWKLPKLELEVKTFWEAVLKVYNGEMEIDFLVNRVLERIQANKDEIFQTAKADLLLKRNLYVNNKLIIPAGKHIEVKKMDYFVDSYMSEFYAIFKDSSLVGELGELDVDVQKFLTIYNTIIDKIYLKLEKESQDIIDEAEEHIFGIIYDKNILIPRFDRKGNKNFEFYWSNKGQRNCDKDHRLSIRFRPTKSAVIGYEYNTETHSDQLKPVKVVVSKSPTGKKITCTPITDKQKGD